MNVKLIGSLAVTAAVLCIGRPALTSGTGYRETSRNTYLSPQIRARIMERIRFEDEGQVYLNYHKYTLAEQSFRNALTVDPRSGGAAYGLAQALEKQGRLKEAVVPYRKVMYARMEGVSRAPSGQFRFANLLDRTGYTTEATAEYRYLVDHDEPAFEYPKLDAKNYSPSEVRSLARMIRGRDMVKNRQNAEGLSLLATAAKTSPSLDIIHAYYALALSESGKSKEANAELSKAKNLGSYYQTFEQRIK